MHSQNKKRRVLIGSLTTVAIVALVLILTFDDDSFRRDDLERLSGGTVGAAPVTFWQGAGTGDHEQTWFAGENWKKKVPSSSTDVIIDKGHSAPALPAEAPVPVHGDTASTRDLYVYAGGRLTFAAIPGPGALKVHGTWHVAYHGEVSMGSGTLIAEGNVEIADEARCDAGDGTILFRGDTWKTGSSIAFFAGTGTVIFEGNGPQVMRGDATFHDLDLRTADTVTIEGHIIVAHELRIRPSTVVIVKEGSSFLPPSSYSNTAAITDLNATAPSLRNIGESSASKTGAAVPSSPILEQNYPNPFNPTTTIRFTAAADDPTTVKVYDIQGREIATLFEEITFAGQSYSVTFDGSGLSSGTYLYVLQAGSVRKTGKMILTR